METPVSGSLSKHKTHEKEDDEVSFFYWEPLACNIKGLIPYSKLLQMMFGTQTHFQKQQAMDGIQLPYCVSPHILTVLIQCSTTEKPLPLPLWSVYECQQLYETITYLQIDSDALNKLFIRPHQDNYGLILESTLRGANWYGVYLFYMMTLPRSVAFTTHHLFTALESVSNIHTHTSNSLDSGTESFLTWFCDLVAGDDNFNSNTTAVENVINIMERLHRAGHVHESSTEGVKQALKLLVSKLENDDSYMRLLRWLTDHHPHYSSIWLLKDVCDQVKAKRINDRDIQGRWMSIYNNILRYGCGDIMALSYVKTILDLFPHTASCIWDIILYHSIVNRRQKNPDPLIQQLISIVMSEEAYHSSLYVRSQHVAAVLFHDEHWKSNVEKLLASHGNNMLSQQAYYHQILQAFLETHWYQDDTVESRSGKLIQDLLLASHRQDVHDKILTWAKDGLPPERYASLSKMYTHVAEKLTRTPE